MLDLCELHALFTLSAAQRAAISLCFSLSPHYGVQRSHDSLSRLAVSCVPTSLALHSRQSEISLRALCLAHTLITVLELELVHETHYTFFLLVCPNCLNIHS